MNSANSANPISIKANHLLNDFVMNISYEKLVEKLSNDFTIINLTPEVKDKLLHMVQNRIDNSIKDTNKLLFYASLKKKIDSDEKDIETVTIKVSDLQKLLDACENNEKQLANTEKQLAITKKQLTTTMNLLRSYINNDSNVNNDSKNNCSSSKQKSEKKFEKKSERQSGWSLKVNGKKQRLNLGNYEDNQCDNTNQCDNNHQNDNNNQNDQCENIYCNQDNQNDNNQCDCFDFVDDIDRDV